MTLASPEFIQVSDEFDSPASAESNFRDLDDAFLQTQTRIWLGEVLQIRLDEETDISVLLADGKLLSELSEVLSRMLPSLSVDPAQPKSNETKSLVSSKSSQRYMPYYNVGSFLKMCKNLGLDSIDLFTPSDVVEKRNTRKVCICIRSLSKRARSKDLNVPDFDNVSCTLTMPTNMVEGIRKSLEMSQSSSPLSAELEADKFSGGRYINRSLNSASAVSNGYSSDICDDAQSRGVLGGESNVPSDYNYDAEVPNMSCSKVTGDYSSTLQVNTRDLEHEDDDQCEYLSPSNGESVGSPCSQYFSDQEINMPSSDCVGSHISGKVDINSEEKPIYQHGDLLQIPISWEDGDLVFENHRDDHANEDEPDCMSPNEQDPDIWVSQSETPTHPEIVSEKSSCSSIGQTSCDPVDSPAEMSNLIEQSSCTVDLSCVSLSALDIQSNGIDDHLISPQLADQRGVSDYDTFVSSETDSSMVSDLDEECLHQESLAVSRSYTPQSNSSVNMEMAEDNKTRFENSQETSVTPAVCRPLDASNSVYINDTDDAPESMEDIEKGKTVHTVQEQEGASKDMPRHKPEKKLLKSVIKGTALVGVAIILLLLRKNRQERQSKVSSKKGVAAPLKASTAPLPSAKKGGKTSSVYPAEKLKFGF